MCNRSWKYDEDMKYVQYKQQQIFTMILSSTSIKVIKAQSKFSPSSADPKSAAEEVGACGSASGKQPHNYGITMGKSTMNGKTYTV